MDGKIKILIVIGIILIAGYGIYYLTDYYPAEDTVNQYMSGTGNVSVVKQSNGLFLDGPGNDSALIFYPGAKVEYTSYLPMFSDLASQGVDCYLLEMPFNIAFFASDSADSVIDNSSYSHYYVSGHSLGGVVASSFANKSDDIDGLILFAAYPTEDINIPVLSIYGSQDKVLDMEKYNESKHLIKGNFTECIIDGANHEQFAYYGSQSGDGKATITPQNQQKQSVSEIIRFIDNT